MEIYRMINKLLRLKDIVKNYNDFGFFFTIKMNLFFCIKQQQYKHKIIITYLEKKYGRIIEQYKQNTRKESIIKSNDPIWYCWLQGKNNMPLLVELCFQSIKKNSGDHPIVFIDIENVHNYISLPEFIWDRFKSGDIGAAHFTDVIRFNLLAKYGGIWLDSTIFLTQKINIHDLVFFSIKKKSSSDIYISQERWCCFCMGGGKNNLLFDFIVAFFNEYYRNHRRVIDYLLLDYIIDIAYRNIPHIKKIIDQVPYTNPNLYYLQNNLFLSSKKKELENVLKDTYIFKLSYKKNEYANENSLFAVLFPEILQKYNASLK